VKIPFQASSLAHGDAESSNLMFDRIIERVLSTLELQTRELVTCSWESLETLMDEKEISDTDHASMTKPFYIFKFLNFASKIYFFIVTVYF
jgi:hypothetical protein